MLVSATTVALTLDVLPAQVTLRELGPVHLKGLDRVEHAYQLDHPELPTVHAPLAGRRRSPRLPTFVTTFVGRDAEVTQLADLLAGARVLTITGAGGSGKTRLADVVVRQVADEFDDEVVWVDRCRVDDGSRVASEVASACGLAESPGGVDAATMVALHLAANRRLVVLDNCEHLLDGVAALVGLITSHQSRSQIVATTREPLGVAGESVWRIPSLRVPAVADDGTQILASDAVRLFADRAASAQPGFAADESSVVTIATICRRLDGIPLAIELGGPGAHDVAGGSGGRAR